MKTKKIVTSAVFAAIITALTLFPRVPWGNGYVHLGDSVILVSSYILGPAFGGLASAIGSSLADLISGFPVFVPATFVIKFIVASISGFMYKTLKIKNVFRCIFYGIVAEVFMIVGYFAFECVVFGVPMAALDIIENVIQAILGVIVSTIIMVIKEKKYEDKI